MTKLKINGELYIKEELSHQEFIYLLMKALEWYGIGFSGSTKEVEDTKIYNKK
ncbi:hypothetical protein AB0Y20_01170 [Heyndrickxia oleronia]|uniref:hypothetical protein n=1 Tax=Heyndrickxia oleronia TaxID=38875 RepID=UPI003F2351B2